VIEQCDYSGVLDKLTNLLYKEEHTIVKESLWAMSNFNASGHRYCEKFIYSSGLHKALDLCNSVNIDIKSEALWCVSSAITLCSDEVMRFAHLIPV